MGELRALDTTRHFGRKPGEKAHKRCDGCGHYCVSVEKPECPCEVNESNGTVNCSKCEKCKNMKRARGW